MCGSYGKDFLNILPFFVYLQLTPLIRPSGVKVITFTDFFILEMLKTEYGYISLACFKKLKIKIVHAGRTVRPTTTDDDR